MQLTTKQLLQAQLHEPSLLLTQHSAYQHWLNLNKKHYDQLTYLPNFQYRKYQYEYSALYCLRANNFCALDMGLGKTLICGLVIASIYAPLINRRPGTIQIAVPSILSGTTRWLADLNKIPALLDQVEFIKTERQALNSTKPIWVYTVDFLKRKSSTYKHTTRPYISRALIRKGLRPSLLILDEAHNLKPKSDRSQHFAYVRQYAKRFLALSGTLSDGRLDLVHHLGQLTYLLHWPYIEREFIKEFAVKKKVATNYIGGEEELVETSQRYLQHLAVNKAPDYYELSRRFFHRVTLNDPNVKDCTLYPTKIEQLEEVEPSATQRDLYVQQVSNQWELLNNLVTYAGQDATYRARAFSLLRPLMLASSAPWELINPAFTSTPEIPAKLLRAVDLIKTAADLNKKTVLFTTSVAAGRFINDYLGQRFGSDKIVRLYASDDLANPSNLSAQNREEVINRFLYDPEVIAGVFQLNLACESIDLTSAGQIIFYDLPWQLIKTQQAVHRAVRPGSIESEVKVITLINKGFIDQHQYSLLEEKKKGASSLIDFDFGYSAPPDAGTINPAELITKLLGTDT